MPAVDPPTHVLRVAHPTDESECWWQGITATSEEQARARQRHLAGWVDFPSKVFLYQYGHPEKPLCYVWGTRR